MANFNDGTFFTLRSATAIPKGALVKIDTNGQAALTAVSTTKDVIGVAIEPAGAANQIIRIAALGKLSQAPVLTDNTAITAGIALYKGANGKVSATATGSVQVGWAQDANGSTDAVIISMIPIQH